VKSNKLYLYGQCLLHVPTVIARRYLFIRMLFYNNNNNNNKLLLHHTEVTELLY